MTLKDKVDDFIDTIAEEVDDVDKSDYDSFSEWAADWHDDYEQDFLRDDYLNFPKIRFLNTLLKGTRSCYVAGGCFKNILTGEKPRDIDVYFFNDAAFNEAVGLFNNRVDQGIAKHAYSSKNVQTYAYDGYTVELVDNWHTDPVNLMMRFDFNIDKFAYDPETEFVYYHKDFFKDLVLHRLSISGYPPYPIGSYNRMFKYAKYGYYPCRETKILLARLINKVKDIKDTDFDKSFYEGFD